MSADDGRAPSRRRVMGWGLGAGVSLLWGGCDPEEGAPAGAACGPADEAEEGWSALALADAPALAEVGGSAIHQDPELLLDLTVAQVEAGVFAAVWRICPHGACGLDYVPDERVFQCPCHGSRFAEDGALLRGPATRGVSAWPVCRQGEVLWIDARARLEGAS